MFTKESILTPTTKIMLFALGEFISELNKRFSSSPLKVFISKAEFIDVIRKMGVITKQERSAYKNLEELEKNKFIVYSNKNLRLSKNGFRQYARIKKEVDSYFTVVGQINFKKIYFERKLQTKLN